MNKAEFARGYSPKGKICWNCKHARFSRRSGDMLGRGLGQCYFLTGSPPFLHNYVPPRMFWNDLEDAVFGNSLEEFVENNAPLYWHDKVKVEKMLGDGLHMPTPLLHTNYQNLSWIRDNIARISEVSWQGTCPEHTLEADDGIQEGVPQKNR